MKIPLIGVPRHLWRMIKGLFSASAGLILWRLLVLGALTFVLLVAASAGLGTVGAIILGFVITTVLSQILRDDLLAVWRDLWNARWGEVKV